MEENAIIFERKMFRKTYGPTRENEISCKRLNIEINITDGIKVRPLRWVGYM